MDLVVSSQRIMKDSALIMTIIILFFILKSLASASVFQSKFDTARCRAFVNVKIEPIRR